MSVQGNSMFLVSTEMLTSSLNAYNEGFFNNYIVKIFALIDLHQENETLNSALT